jgi:hypothetical protein
MAYRDEFFCTEVRFKFWNGKKIYTVQYSPGIRWWIIFDEETRENSLAHYELGKKEPAIVSHAVARLYLDKYFQSINSNFHTVNY